MATKQGGGTFRADELPRGFNNKTGAAVASGAGAGTGSGVTKPTPVNFPWLIYTVVAGGDDKPGLYCLASVDVPKDTKRLEFKYSYVKKNGAYGRVLHSEHFHVDAAHRAVGHIDVEFGPLRPNARLDIVRMNAICPGKDKKNPPDDQPDRRGTGTTPAYAPPALPGAWPPAPYANQIPGDGLPLTMATILLGDYITGFVRVESVAAPVTGEEEGLYYPATIACTQNADLLISLRFGVFKIGKRVGSPLKVDLAQYGSRQDLPRYTLTEAERDTLASTGSLTVNVGPLKSKKAYDILWVRGRFSLDPDDEGARAIRHRWPVATIVAGVDTSLSANPADTAPINSKNHLDVVIPVPGAVTTFPAGAAMLGRLDYNSAIVGNVSDPAAGKIILNEPNEATRRDHDSLTALRIYAHPTDTTVRFIDANLQEVVAITSRWADRNSPDKWQHDRLTLETPATDPGGAAQQGTWWATYADVNVKGQMGAPMAWVKNVGKNLADRVVSAVVKLRYEAGAGYADTDAHTKISAGTCSAATDAETNKETDVTVAYTNDATNPAIPRKLIIFRSKGDLGAPPTFNSGVADTGNASWKALGPFHVRTDADLAQPGAISKVFNVPGAPVKRKYYAWRLYVVGSTTSVNSSVSAQVTGLPGEGVPPPAAAALASDVSFKEASMGSGQMHVICGKPGDGRQFLRFDFAFYTLSSIGAGSFINPRTGASLAGSLPAGAATDGSTNPAFEGSGKRWVSQLRRQDLKAVLASLPAEGATAFYVYARIVDTVDGATERFGAWTSTGSAVTYHAHGLDPDAALPPRHYAHGTKNLLVGGFLFSREDSGDSAVPTDLAKQWWTNTGTGAPTRINTTAANSIWYWEKNNHNLVLAAVGGGGAGSTFTSDWASCYVKRQFQPGETLTLTGLFQRNASLALPGTTPTWEAQILDADPTASPWTIGTVIWSDSVSIQPNIPTTGYAMNVLSGIVAAYTIPANRRMIFRTRITMGNSSSAARLHMANLMLVHGNVALTWEINSQEEDWGSGGAATAETRTDTGTGTIDATAGGGNDGVVRGYISI